jgi:hypothetical protein
MLGGGGRTLGGGGRTLGGGGRTLGGAPAGRDSGGGRGPVEAPGGERTGGGGGRTLPGADAGDDPSGRGAAWRGWEPGRGGGRGRATSRSVPPGRGGRLGGRGGVDAALGLDFSDISSVPSSGGRTSVISVSEGSFFSFISRKLEAGRA